VTTANPGRKNALDDGSLGDVLDALPSHVAVLDADGKVVATNAPWRALASNEPPSPGHPRVGDLLWDAWDEPDVARTVRDGIGELPPGGRSSLELEYRCPLAEESRWFALHAAPRACGGAVVTQTDVTRSKSAEARHAKENATAHIDQALARAGREFIGSLEISDILSRLCRLTMELLRCDTSHTLLWQEEDSTYLTAATLGETTERDEMLRALRVPRDAFLGAVARGEESEIVEIDIHTLRDAPLRPLVERLGVDVFLQIALRHGDRTIGFQTACRRRHEPFSDEEKHLARRPGQLASLAIENTRLVGQLGEASRLKSEFVATVSHELRTPIHVVLGFAELMLEGEYGPLSSCQRETLNRILFGARSLLELSEAALELMRLDATQIPIRLESVSVAEILHEVEREIVGPRPKNDVALRFAVSKDLDELRSDRGKLKLILKNLIGNALKFTDAGHVTVSARRTNGTLELVVEDTGVGIPEASLPFIFDAFRQADGSTTRRFGGVGLGLHIVRRAVERLGGSIRATSVEGRGSRFDVRIPFLAALR